MILEMLLGSSALILAVFALRAVLGRRMGARLRYALWLLVLLRLLLPVHLGRSAVSPANLARVSERDRTVYSVPLATGQPPALGVSVGPDGKLGDANSFGYPIANADGTVTRYGWKHTLPDILPLIWKIGIAVAAAWYLLCNVLFYRGLRRTRRPLRTLGKVPVYVADTPSPCLFGLFRPAIYVTAEAARDPDTLSHVLLHEGTHLRHGDHLWAFLRTVCLTVWWFNPLVYLAAAASRRDCELFCDDAVIRLLGEERRVEYGRTLLTLAGKKRAGTASCAAATLSSGGRPLRQRIHAIAKWAKPKKWAILATAVLALLAGACAFSGARENATAEPKPLAAPEALEPTPRPETGSDAAAPEFPPTEEAVRTVAEGLGWTLDPEGTQSWAENHILYTFETGEQTNVAVSCALDEGKRFLTETCFAIFLPDKPQFAWEDWKKSVTLAETLYGGFSEGELYQALSGQNIPEPEIPPAGPDTPTGLESLIWEAELPAGYGRVRWSINAGTVERSFPSPVIRDWRITFFVSIYESREVYENQTINEFPLEKTGTTYDLIDIFFSSAVDIDGNDGLRAIEKIVPEFQIKSSDINSKRVASGQLEVRFASEFTVSKEKAKALGSTYFSEAINDIVSLAAKQNVTIPPDLDDSVFQFFVKSQALETSDQDIIELVKFIDIYENYEYNLKMKELVSTLENTVFSSTTEFVTDTSLRELLSMMPIAGVSTAETASLQSVAERTESTLSLSRYNPDEAVN